MATQGIVSVRKDGEMALKIVAGQDGYNAFKVADAIRALGRLPTVNEAYDIASMLTFGGPRCLVVVSPTEVHYRGGLDPNNILDSGPSELFRSTFRDPRFNPRWKQGIADFVEVVNLWSMPSAKPVSKYAKIPRRVQRHSKEYKWAVNSLLLGRR